MPDNNQWKKEQKVLNNYARYSGVGIKMAVIIFAGTFGGIKLDKLVKLKFPVFTVVLSLGSVFLALYVVIKELAGKK